VAEEGVYSADVVAGSTSWIAAKAKECEFNSYFSGGVAAPDY